MANFLIRGEDLYIWPANGNDAVNESEVRETIALLRADGRESAVNNLYVVPVPPEGLLCWQGCPVNVELMLLAYRVGGKFVVEESQIFALQECFRI